MLKDCNADLIFTGELSHHEALAVTERGGCVVALFHSNSERGFLEGMMKDALERELEGEWGRVRREYGKGEEVPEELRDALADESVRVEVSRVDRDPYGIVVLQGSEVEGMKI